MPKKSTIKIDSLDDADRALQRIGELRREIAAAERIANAKIDALRAKLVDDTEIFRETLAQNETALEAWGEANKNLFVEPRSMELNWGRVGFRLSGWKIVVLGKLKLDTIVEKIRAAKLPQLIRVKEEIEKEAALNYDNEDLARCGLKKKQTDDFFFEVKQVEVKRCD